VNVVRNGAWEFSSSAGGFGEDAPAPARVGKRSADSVGVALPDTSEYEGQTLSKDLGARLVYGATLGGVLTIAGLCRRR